MNVKIKNKIFALNRKMTKSFIKTTHWLPADNSSFTTVKKNIFIIC